MIHIIISAYGEPTSTERAVNLFLNQNIKEKFKIIVMDPFPKVKEYLTKKFGKIKEFEFFEDPGEGKSYALNLILEKIYSENKNDIIILTDGDVFVNENSVQEIITAFKNPNVGCVGGRAIPLDNRNEKYGYWARFTFAGIDKVRRKLSKEKKFFECSGYLFAIRNGLIKEFSLKASEDAVMPYLIWEKGYLIQYIPSAEVYVKNPSNLKEYISQKRRNIKGHEGLNKIFPKMPRTKSMFNEIKHGWYFLFLYPKNLKEFFWTIQLYFVRLKIYLITFKELKEKKEYSDGWRGEDLTPSTSPLN
jgi:cellulose synthase/poly-beta-1,6-N-acetylglucosamine synthase-like glycosyltransferase